MKKTGNSVKYYVYVSKSKVEMIYAQIPQSIRFRLSAELKLNLQFISTTFTEKQVDNPTYSKLNIVTAYLQKHSKIGTIEAPAEYFHGIAMMQWAQIHPGIVYFGGNSDNTMIGLGGSLQHLLGYHTGDVEPGISHTPWLVSILARQLELHMNDLPNLPNISGEDEQNRVLNAASYWSEELGKNAEMKFEFIAKKLRSANHFGKNVLLGTPIYVALAD